jgi:hypothetical protein
MPGISFITHKGVSILYEDFSQSKPDEVLALIEKASTIISSQPKNSVLGLVNVKDSSFDTRVTNAIKEFAKNNAPYMKCSAVYGVEGLKEVIFRGVIAFTGRKNLVLCKTLEEAKDFLADQK